MKYLILIVLLLLYSCCPKPEQQSKTLTGELEQFSDVENSVVCYRVFGYNGLSCVKTK